MRLLYKILLFFIITALIVSCRSSRTTSESYLETNFPATAVSDSVQLPIIAKSPQEDVGKESTTKAAYFNEVDSLLTVVLDTVAKLDTVEKLKILYTVSELIGKVNFQDDTSFVPVTQYAGKEGMYLKREAYQAFLKMADAAKKDGINLVILSAARDFNHQKGIWENKWAYKYAHISNPVMRAREILQYSAMPGSSRHHWGTEVDLNALSNGYFSTGEGKKIYDWLLANAGNYGFCQVYGNKTERDGKGYNEERWHWSYLPISEKLLHDYLQQINYDFIQGFLGAETAPEIQIIENYVKSLNGGCH
ncbi:MAG: M15 family metallopeptidase [Chitinophagales bacterium]|nr:M15 family metallopeptidase [Chitinophagales bacterium]